MKTISWGKSMYGGWYVNFFKEGKVEGKHFQKRHELKSFADDNGLELVTIQRFDN